jgi:hypothetical protein
VGHADQRGLVEIDLAAVEELPAVIVGIVADEQDRRTVEHGPNRDRGRIRRLVEGPVLLVGHVTPATRSGRRVLLRVAVAVLALGLLHDGDRFSHRPAVLVSGPLEILVGDVVLAHLEVGVHAAARQAHWVVLLRNVFLKEEIVARTGSD